MDQASDTLRRLCRPTSFLNPDLIAAPASWLGHVPFAFWVVDALRPGTLVELGTHTGNSYAAFCQSVKHLALPTSCFAVDTWEGDPQAGYYGDEVHRTLEAWHEPRFGSFSRLMRMTFDQAVEHFSDGTVDLLHIDGLHTYEAVRHDFETWRPKMSRHGVVLFHDINVRKGDFGVWRLWEELAAGHPHFAFLHSNGLGVLGVGTDFTQEIRWLFGAQAENGAALQETRAFFDRLGSGIVNTFTAYDLTRAVADLAQAKDDVIRARDAEIQALHTKVWERDHTLEAHIAMVHERDRILGEQHQALEAHIAMVHERDRILGAQHQALEAHVEQHQAHEARIADQEQRIAALDGQVSALDRALHEHAAMVHDRDHAIQGLHGVVAERDRHIHALVNSTSWKLTAPVRRLRRLAARAKHMALRSVGGRLLRLHRSTVHHMALKPLWHLEERDGRFESTGSDPAFLLVSDQDRLPTGWCLLSFTVSDAASTLVPILYVDSGAGFSDATATVLPPVRRGRVEHLIALPPGTTALRFDPTIERTGFRLTEMTIREIGSAQVLARLVQRHGKGWRTGLDTLRTQGWAKTRQLMIHRLLASRPVQTYDSWVALYDTLQPEDREAIRSHVSRLERRPLISVVMPVYNTPIPFLRQALDSVINQLYPDWELCIADDASPNAEVQTVLAEYAAKDARIKVMRRTSNGNISAASNSALDLATGVFVALMDHDDLLPEHALYMVALELDQHPDTDVIYSDEDKIDADNLRYGAYFKSDWNHDLLCGHNMISHLGVYRTELLRRIGGFRLGYEGSQDYDLALRAVDATTPDRIRHIPRILYHWRVFEESTSFSNTELPRATKAARQAVQDHLDRTGSGATALAATGIESFTRVAYPLPDPAPHITLIVPTRDKAELLRQCMDGLLNGTDYPALDVIIVDNGSTEAETHAYFAELAADPRVYVLRYDKPFNYSALNNAAAAMAKGELIGLINNDIKVIEPGWLKEMVSHAVRPGIGAVGAKLYYADDRVQHAGVVIGIHGVANHIHKFASRDDVGYFGRLKLVQEYSCVTAACLVLRKSVFDEVQGLDAENLAVSFNDVDLCLRIRERGYRNIWTPYAELYHLESVSRGLDTNPDQVERFMREVSYMKTRWDHILTMDPYYNPNLTLEDVNFAFAFPPRVGKPWLTAPAAAPTPRIKEDA